MSWFAATAVALGVVRACPLPLAETILLGEAACVFALYGRTRRIAGLPLPALLFAVWLMLGLGSGDLRTAVREAGQLVAVLLAASVLAPLARDRVSRGVGVGAAIGLAVCLAAAVVQLLRGTPPHAIGGTLGSRALLGAVVAACLPLVLATISQRSPQRLRNPLAALFVLLALGSCSHLPGFVLAIVSVATWSAVCGDRTGGTGAFAGMCVAVAILLLGPSTHVHRHQSALIQSVARTDSRGGARRWVVELQAGWRAVKESPFLGYGPGSYQSTVSAGRFRHSLPEPVENVVERDTQCGYLVLAVEYGFPAAAMFAAMLLAAAVSAWRTSAPHDLGREMSIALVVMAVGMGFTPLTVRGVYVLVAVTLALASRPVTMHVTWPRAAYAHAVALAVTGAVALFLGVVPRQHVRPIRQTVSPAGSATVIQVEAESAETLPSTLHVVDDPEAAGGKAVAAVDMENDRLRTQTGEATYWLHVDRPGRLSTWLRVWWAHGCGNSVSLAIDDAPASLVGNDGTYRVWHWVRGPEFDCDEGAHALRLFPREMLARVDRILLVNDPAYDPAVGDLPSSTPTHDVTAPAAQTIASTDRESPGHFLAGVGGMYQNGPESFFVGLGIPHERLRDDELASPEALARYDLLWISGPERRQTDVWQALAGYVRHGGIAILEKMAQQHAAGDMYAVTPAERELVPQGRLDSRVTSTHRRGQGLVTVRGEGSRFFDGIAADMPVYEDIVVSGIPGLSAGAGEVHGAMFQHGHRIGAAITKRRVGDGVVYALALPLGNISMWRGPKFDPVAQRVLADAIGDRCEWLFADLAWASRPEGDVFFGDDFMRHAGELGAWRPERGTFSATGAPPPPPPRFSYVRHRRRGPDHPFAFAAEGEASVSAGSATWGDYRVSCSILPEHGAGGVWLTTTGNRRLSLVYDGSTQRLQLLASNGDTVAVLAEERIPGSAQGWRRLSLLKRDRQWTGWIDGRAVLTGPMEEEDTQGVFGLVNLRGQIVYDDVRVRSVSALLAGRDVCAGEEASCRSDLPMTRGLEPRTIYAPQWYLQPDPDQRHAVRAALPTYGPSEFLIDDAVVGVVPAAADGPFLCLPEGIRPTRTIELRNSQWRDYNFAGQPADWYATGGEWTRIPRWACDQEWEWLGVKPTDGPTALWYRQRMSPPYAVSFLVAPTMGEGHGFNEADRDLNIVVGGNGSDLEAGYLLETGPAGRGGCTLICGGRTLAAAPSVGLPAGGGLTLHHRWIWLKAIIEPDRVRFFYEGRCAIDAPVDIPADGFAGFWTRGSSVQVARATVVPSR